MVVCRRVVGLVVHGRNLVVAVGVVAGVLLMAPTILHAEVGNSVLLASHTTLRNPQEADQASEQLEGLVAKGDRVSDARAQEGGTQETQEQNQTSQTQEVGEKTRAGGGEITGREQLAVHLSVGYGLAMYDFTPSQPIIDIEAGVDKPLSDGWRWAVAYVGHFTMEPNLQSLNLSVLCDGFRSSPAARFYPVLEAGLSASLFLDGTEYLDWLPTVFGGAGVRFRVTNWMAMMLHVRVHQPLATIEYEHSGFFDEDYHYDPVHTRYVLPHFGFVFSF